MRPVEGTLLGNRYKLTSRIAVGGMGEVWKGTDNVLGREVAAKILKDEYLSDPSFLARFQAEAQNMGRVSDPGIAGVYDYGDEKGSPYLVMEYVPGEPLSTIIERSAPLSEADTLSIIFQAAQALGAAHKVGVVHRDIKPGNILMTPDFRVKITDFGIARVTDQAPLTKTGQVMGTAQYLAPEQATGKGSGPGSDLYSLGIIAYEALAGQRPFTGDSQVAIAIAQVNQQHPPLPTTVSEPLRRLVDSLLEKKPDRRPSDAMAVSRAAQCLSKDDLAGAETAVPQMRLGNAASEALTQVFSTPEPTPTTQVLPTTSADPTRVYSADSAATPGSNAALDPSAAEGGTEGLDDEVDQKSAKKGKAAIWILAIIALIAVGALLFYFLGNYGAEPEPDPSTSAPTSQAPATVTIDPDDFIGLSETSAKDNLEQQGLESDTRSVESEEPAGTVADVREGDNGYTFTEGDTVVLEISTGPQTDPEPDPDTAPPSSPSNDQDSTDSTGSSPSQPSSTSSTDGSGSDSEDSADDESTDSATSTSADDSTASSDTNAGNNDTANAEADNDTAEGQSTSTSENADTDTTSGGLGGNGADKGSTGTEAGGQDGGDG